MACSSNVIFGALTKKSLSDSRVNFSLDKGGDLSGVGKKENQKKNLTL